MFLFWRKQRPAKKLEDQVAISKVSTGTQPVCQPQLESVGEPAGTQNKQAGEAETVPGELEPHHLNQLASLGPISGSTTSPELILSESAAAPDDRARSDDSSALLPSSLVSQVEEQNVEFQTAGLAPTMAVDQPQATESTIMYFTPGSYAGINPAAVRFMPASSSDFIRYPRASSEPAKYGLSADQATFEFSDYLVTRKPASVVEALQAVLPSGSLPALDPIIGGLFLTRAESDPRVPAEATRAYLEDPAILVLTIQLLNRVVQNWSNGGGPLRPDELVTLAGGIVDDAPTALLLCHNVTRAFANYSSALRWHLVDRTRGEYTDCALIYTAKINHPESVLSPSENPIFFCLFTAGDFTSDKPSLWPHRFAIATAAAYAAKSRVALGGTLLTNFATEFKDAIEQATRSIVDPSQAPRPDYRAWLWANALSLVELTDWRGTESELAEISRSDLRATAFGLAQVGTTLDQKWRWSVPSGDRLPISAAE